MIGKAYLRKSDACYHNIKKYLSYFDAGIPVWDLKLRPLNCQSVKINSFKNRQMAVHVLVPQCGFSVVSY